MDFLLLQEVLGYSDEVLRSGQGLPPGLEAHIAEHNETLRPDMAVVNPDDDESEPGKPRILIQALNPGQGVEKAQAGSKWKATPATRMMELLHATDVRLGLVTNGEQWTLVHAPRGETSSFVTWYASLWGEERLTLQAFRTLLAPMRFFGVAANETLEALFADSALNQQDVTDQLGYQVRKAVEVLVQAIDRIDKDRGRALLAGVDEKRLYDAALTVMMRLVFLFYAEEQHLLPLEDPFYLTTYAVSVLREELRKEADAHGEEILERHHDAWSRLLAAFRVVYGGIEHDICRLPAHGGSLFNPDRYPFLEGRIGGHWRETPAEPLPINNRTVLHLLEALQILQVRMPGGGMAEARRLSFRGLDIEQIGHVYEGLLDHTAMRAGETVLGLTGPKDSEEEIPLSELERQREKGIDALVAYLRERTKKSENALRKVVESPAMLDEGRLLIACDNDPAMLARVRPYAALLRDDTMDYPVVITSGSIYVTQGSDRRTTGTHYTPRSLTEPVVKHTLDPLIYDGPADGKPAEEWVLKSARAILKLKVCDMAMGSGAFLVQACRYLSEALVDAWSQAEEAAGGALVVTPEGDLAQGIPDERPLPTDPDERLIIARRIVADRCLFGVDINPMAVEMAKLSLWLTTFARRKPFNFLDHALKCGDSLLGVNLRQLKAWSLDPGVEGTPDAYVMDVFDMGRRIREKIESISNDESIETIERKERWHAQAEGQLKTLKLAGDLILATAFTRQQGDAEERARGLQAFYRSVFTDPSQSGQIKEAISPLGQCRTFHWPLEFPEVFADGGGFDAIIGNPPFQGGKRISGSHGDDYREYLVNYTASGTRGNADLCAYFFLRASNLLAMSGTMGMLATNTIAQGETRAVGLDQILHQGNTVIRAIPSMKWPGTATLEVSIIWLHRGRWGGHCQLDGHRVPSITSLLSSPGAVTGKPHRLVANGGRAYQGTIVFGMGFLISEEEMRYLISSDPDNRDVLFPYLNGEDLNSRADQQPSRWVINFYDWPLARTAGGSWCSSTSEQQRTWLRTGIVPQDYPHPVAADYRDCLTIIEERVKPDRLSRSKEVASAPWWQFWRIRQDLYTALEGMTRVLVVSRVSKYFGVSFVPSGWIYNERLTVFASESARDYALLQNSFHEYWMLLYGSTLENRPMYTPSDCYETYPFPTRDGDLPMIGEKYHAHRLTVMRKMQVGLTQVYNAFHDDSAIAPDIQHLRKLHVKLDYAVASAYGWDNLVLDHGFHQTKQGLRFTISEPARREVLDRLLALNHARYEEEVRQGLHDKGAKKAGGGKKGKKTSGDQNVLFTS